MHRIVHLTVAFLLVLLGSGLVRTDAVRPQPAAAAGPSVITTIPVGDGPGAIAVNPFTNRVYASSFYDDKLWVIDGDSHSVITNFSPGVSGIVTDPVANRLYVSHGATVDATQSYHYVSVHDGSTNEVLAIIPFSRPPWGLELNEPANLLYVSTTSATNAPVLAVVDTETNSSATEVVVPTYLGDLALNSETNRLRVKSREFCKYPPRPGRSSSQSAASAGPGRS
jgi:DNA-binding beta-propeller fold protein YncE